MSYSPKIKSGDTVQVISGKDRGKSGKVIQVLPEAGRVAVEGINKMFKFARGRRGAKGQEKGQKIEFWGPLQISNVSLICSKCGKKTRVTSRVMGGVKTRECRKCKQTI